jgi:hypothetical protein
MNSKEWVPPTWWLQVIHNTYCPPPHPKPYPLSSMNDLPYWSTESHREPYGLVNLCVQYQRTPRRKLRPFAAKNRNWSTPSFVGLPVEQWTLTAYHCCILSTPEGDCDDLSIFCAIKAMLPLWDFTNFFNPPPRSRAFIVFNNHATLTFPKWIAQDTPLLLSTILNSENPSSTESSNILASMKKWLESPS